MPQPYRVVQWATGSIGRVCARYVVDNDGYELAGMWAHSPGKAGKDAGEVLRRQRTGIPVTDDPREILALDADVVLHTPLNGESPEQHLGDIVALLRSGKNVITTVAYTYPWALGQEITGRLEQAARDGGVTLFGTGVNPGMATERLAVTATSICTEVRHITMREVYDCAPVISPGFIFDLCGFGRTPEHFQQAQAGRRDFFTSLFSESIGYVGHALGVEFVGVEGDHEIAVTEQDLHLPATLPAGTVSCARWRWHAHTETGPFLTLQMGWRADPAQPSFAGEDGWTVTIDGAPKLHMRVGLDDPDGMPDKSKAMQYAVAGPVVRAIAETVTAPPGILLPPTFAAWQPAVTASAVS